MKSKEREVIEKAMAGGYETLNDYCKEWRVSKSLSQSDIARESGLSKSCVCRYEKGDVKSPAAISGYMSYGMPLPYNLIMEYLKKEE